jgi:molecular chaperone DnaK (HSP70)
MLRAVVYQLGVDLGTTFTAAAVHRTSTSAEVVALSPRSASVPSVLYLGEDSGVLVGEAAERRAVTDPERVIREFKRRIGDPTPLMVAGTPQHAHELAGSLARWVVDRVTEREGAAPDRIAITHPAGWGPHKLALLAEGLSAAGLDEVAFLTEPEAAAVHYASAQRIEPGGTIAVYDLGGGTFDAAVLRRTECAGFELLGRPEGIERLGGIDFDEVVFDHVRASIANVDELDPEDPVTVAAVARLRRDCTEAKEALSTDTEVTIPVLLPGTRAQIRLVRGEFEAMIRPALADTVDALRRTVRSAGLEPDDLAAVLLVGGSSRIPLVAQLISVELGRPVAVDTDQSTSVATGAALAAFDTRPVITRTDPPTRPVVTTAPLPAPAPRRRKGPKIVVGAAGIMAIGVAALAAVTWTDRSTGTTTPGEPNQTVPAPKAPAELNVRATVPRNTATSPSRTTTTAPSTTPVAASKPTTTAATTTALPRVEPPTPVVEPPVTTTFSPPPPSVTSSPETPPPPDPPSTRPPSR